MMYHGMGSPKGIVIFLISLGVGYLVCANAESQKGLMKKLGLLIGAIILLATILMSLCRVYCYAAKKVSCYKPMAGISSPMHVKK